MSVAINQYIIYGIKFEYQEIKDSLKKIYGEEQGIQKYEEMCDLLNDNGYKKEIGEYAGLSLISDGMNGKYEVLGKVYEKTTQGNYIDYFAIEMSNSMVNEMALSIMVSLYGDILMTVFQVEKSKLKDKLREKAKMMLLTHYH